MKKYILIGIPNSGKSTIGRRTAEQLQIPFFDTDQMAYSKLTIERPTDLFRPSTIRQMNTEQYNAMVELATLDSMAMISTGAEIALMPECVALMQNMGTIIHVQRKLDTILEGLQKNNENQMILRNMNSGKDIVMREEAVRLYEQELFQYESLADVTLDNNGSEDDGVEKLVMIVKELSKM